ncbi:MAG: peptide deformylase [Planctomycetota bacterium]|nr:peptide deformylase [Planctomycetota bacterium]MDI6787873.1 peptide deformylase [Planctomycetota bacterium]
MKLLIYPDPLLKRKPLKVNIFSKNLHKTIQKMFQMLYKFNGVGLAATQLGLPYNIAVINPSREAHKEIALINLKITRMSEETSNEEEGCLSLPGLSTRVKRSLKVTCEYFNPDGKKMTMDADGLIARIIQHEADHLNGILFIDRLPEEQQEYLLSKYKKTS